MGTVLGRRMSCVYCWDNPCTCHIPNDIKEKKAMDEFKGIVDFTKDWTPCLPIEKEDLVATFKKDIIAVHKKIVKLHY